MDEPSTQTRQLDGSSHAIERRRTVLNYLQETPAETASLSDLSRYVVERRPDLDPEDREAVRLRLHHADLPKLDAAEALDYDAEDRTIRLSGTPGDDAVFATLV